MGILIEPVSLISVGSHPITITAIDPTSPDCLIGTISNTALGTTRHRWNLDGLMRDGSAPLNIDVYSDEMKQLVQLAKKLGAPT